ncbi:carbon-nitrogen hydrolase family protein [Allokutzneria oryzae]|uniref:Carbon-nitrogen hydrolase family protein n=1 Tax=Allokutzneria oryzae TaxID=1378989 RepID=A0ABV6A1N8_9PSEU
MSVVAALQLGACPSGTAATVEKVLGYEEEIRAARAELVVLPEAVLGGYPKGSSFGTRVGYRLPEGRAEFAEYFARAVEVPGPEVAELAGLSARTGASLVVGVIERAGSTLYCTAVFLDPVRGVVAKHRKLMPTAAERLIWGQGDGSTLPVVPTAVGLAGAVICWENYMPLLRTAMYAKGVQVWCAPTVDDREVWQSTMRHIAVEGRCFVVGSCQFQPPASLPDWDPRRPVVNGGSVVVGPLGDVLAGPLCGEEGLLTAEIDVSELPGARYDFDVTGHYARPDVFTLSVDETPRSPVTFHSS